MFDLVFAVVGILLVLGGTLMWQFKGSIKDIVKYFKKNLGVLWGIVFFTGAFIAIAVATLVFSPKAEADGIKDLTYFNYAEVFVGMDYTKKLSPMCYKGEYSDRLTSNGGVRLNLVRTMSKRVEVNTLYTHHSCAYNRDREQYDAFGVQVTWKIFGN
jgi:hypothetical protein